MLFSTCKIGTAQDFKSEKQLIKGADDFFSQKQYKEAIPLYSTLVSNYPKDPTYNYKYGASLLYGSSDKEKPIKYLKFAISRPEVDPIAYFYYAEALHLNYEFNQAIKFYKKFTNNANNSTIKKNTVDNQIRQCENGKTLLKTITDLIVLDEKKTREQDFYKVYDLSAQGGQILVKIDEFRSPYEIKNDINGLFYFPKDADKIFFSSHTLDNRNGKDLYYAIKNEDGSWSKPISLGKNINTDFDEDFPYMSSDGTTLYFASQGHNSLGGYDIFVSRLDTNSGEWTSPQNLDFAINTPANDYLFIPDASGETAFFASERSTPVGEVSVYQINMERVPLDFTFIYGGFTAETTKKANIKVENVETNAIIGEYTTDENGKYKIKLPNDGKFRFLVDYEGSDVTHSGEVDLNERNTFKPLKQEMLVMGQGTDNEKLIIKNLVDEEVEEDVTLTAAFFKEKAKLKVNKDKYKDKKPKLTTPVVKPAGVSQSTEQPNMIADSREEQGKAASNIAEELVINTNDTSSNDGPALTVNEEQGSQDSGVSGSDNSEDESSNSGNADTQNVISNESKVDGSTGSVASNTTNVEAGNESEGSKEAGSSSGDSESGSVTSGNVSGGDMNFAFASDAEKIAFKSALIPAAGAAKNVSEQAIKNNQQVANNSAKMMDLQAEAAQNISDRKNMEAAKLKAEASNELAILKTLEEVDESSNEFKAVQEKLDQAELLEKQAIIAAKASTELISDKVSLERVVTQGAQLASSIINETTENSSEEIGAYNQLLEEEADQAYNIYEQRAVAEAAHKEEEKEYQHFADELAALKLEMADSEQIIEQKETALKSAKGKEAKDVESELLQEKAALSAMEEKVAKDEVEVAKLKEESEEQEAELAAFDAIISDLTTNESYTELAAAPNVIDGAGSINDSRSTESNIVEDNLAHVEVTTSSKEGFEANQNLQAGSELAVTPNSNDEPLTSNSVENSSNESSNNSNTDEEANAAGNSTLDDVAVNNELSSSNENENENEVHDDVQGANENAAEIIGTVESENGDEMIAQQRTSSSQEEKDILADNATAPLAVANVPSNLSNVNTEIPEVDTKFTLYPDFEEGDTLSQLEQDLMPSEGNETSAFIPENSLAALSNEDQSLRAQMKTGYHQAYMEEFFELAEEEDEYTKAVNTYVLNQSWLLDVEKEINYLESIEGEVPQEQFSAVKQRKTALESFRDTKLNDVESSKEKLEEATASQDQNTGEMAAEFRGEMNRVFEGKGRLSSEEIAEEKARREEDEKRKQEELQARMAAAQASAASQEPSDAAGESTNESSDGSDLGFADNGTQAEQEEGGAENELAAATENEANGESSANALDNQGAISREENTKENGIEATNGVDNDGSSTASSEENASSSNENSTADLAIEGEDGTEIDDLSSSDANRGDAENETSASAGSDSGNNSAQNNGNSNLENNSTKNGVEDDAGELGNAESGAAGNSNENNALGQQESGVNGNSNSNNGSNGSNNSQSNFLTNSATVPPVAKTNSGEIIPNKNEDKLAEVLNMQNTGTVEAIVTDYTAKIDKEENEKKAVAESERKLIRDKQKEFANSDKKRQQELANEIREEEQIVELMEQEAEILEYNKAAVGRAADNVLASQPGDERDSEKELKKALVVEQEAVETRESASARSAEKARGKKKKAAKADEVDALNHRADKLEFEANSLKELSKELEKIEEEVLTAEAGGNGPVVLPKPTRTLSQAEVQEIQSTDEFAAYDEDRKGAIKSYKKAQVLYQEKMSLEAQNKVIDAEIQNVKTDISNSTDETQKEELMSKLEDLETSKVDNTKLMNQKEAESRAAYSAYNKQNAAAINKLKSVEGEQGEKLIALANTAEINGVYSLTSSGTSTVLASNGTDTNENGQGNPSGQKNQSTQEGGEGYSTDKFNRVVQGIDNYPAELSDAIFKMIDFNESLYSEDNPIPMNNNLPTGLVYKVQIGAFRNAPPQDIYKGFAPVRGETTRPGWIRYTAGLFNDKSQARLKRNEIRALGYEDAFVVAYLNGERVSLARAKDIETGAEKVPVVASNQSVNVAAGETPVVPVSAVTGEVKQLSDIKGLMYTVQVGAFKNQVTSNELFGISPLIEYRAGNLYKYGSGIYNNLESASGAKDKIQALGVADAFVTAFFDGNRVSMDEALNLANAGGNFATEQPVTITTPVTNSSAGINFRVQVGAYRQEVPVEDAKIILSLSNLGLDVQKEGDLTLYTAGNYSSYAQAKQMQTQVVNQGLDGAFVVALRNGEKIDLQEAIQLSGQ